MISEWIIDGAPGVGKTTLINDMYKELNKKIQKKKNLVVLLNGALPEENNDEFILSAPPKGEISFIQKRYDPNHCYKHENIHSILTFHETNYKNDLRLAQKIKKQYPNSHIFNIRERDGPASAIVFNWTTFKDLVQSQKSKTYKFSWEEILFKTDQFLTKWIREIKESNIQKHFIYLKATPKFSYQGVKKRNRQYEADAYTMELSSSIVNSYNEFFDTSQLEGGGQKKLFDLYDKKITTLQTFNAGDNYLPNIIADLIVGSFNKCSE